MQAAKWFAINHESWGNTHQQEGKYDAADEEVLCDMERDRYATVYGMTLGSEGSGKGFCGREHGYSGKDIGHVDKEVFEDYKIEPEVSGESWLLDQSRCLKSKSNREPNA
jgi:hypothetical protein